MGSDARLPSRTGFPWVLYFAFASDDCISGGHSNEALWNEDGSAKGSATEPIWRVTGFEPARGVFVQIGADRRGQCSSREPPPNLHNKKEAYARNGKSRLVKPAVILCVLCLAEWVIEQRNEFEGLYMYITSKHMKTNPIMSPCHNNTA